MKPKPRRKDTEARSERRADEAAAGHIYLRSLGEIEWKGQSEAVTRAVEQFKEVVKLDPSDTESALWLRGFTGCRTGTSRRRSASAEF